MYQRDQSSKDNLAVSVLLFGRRKIVLCVFYCYGAAVRVRRESMHHHPGPGMLSMTTLLFVPLHLGGRRLWCMHSFVSTLGFGERYAQVNGHMRMGSCTRPRFVPVCLSVSSQRRGWSGPGGWLHKL